MYGQMVEPEPTTLLVGRAQAGDRAAYDALVERYRARLCPVVEKQVQSRKHLEVEEVLQETFVRGFESLGRFRWQGENSFYLWLCGIARNVVLKMAEKAQAGRPLEFPENVAGAAASPSKVMRRHERFDRFEAAVAALPPEYREVIRLSRLEGLKVAEIAERLGRTEYSVRHLIARAILDLRKKMGHTESLHLPDRALRIEGESDGKE
jgi:RNA polymerase sigma-70 factor (ECF subfamily)